jgi:hypothetical protein
LFAPASVCGAPRERQRSRTTRDDRWRTGTRLGLDRLRGGPGDERRADRPGCTPRPRQRSSTDACHLTDTRIRRRGSSPMRCTNRDRLIPNSHHMHMPALCLVLDRLQPGWRGLRLRPPHQLAIPKLGAATVTAYHPGGAEWAPGRMRAARVHDSDGSADRRVEAHIRELRLPSWWLPRRRAHVRLFQSQERKAGAPVETHRLHGGSLYPIRW